MRGVTALFSKYCKGGEQSPHFVRTKCAFRLNKVAYCFCDMRIPFLQCGFAGRQHNGIKSVKVGFCNGVLKNPRPCMRR